VRVSRPPLHAWAGLLTGSAVHVLAGGAGFTGSIESIAELRAHAQAIRGLKPLPAWVFGVLDKLEEQEAECPAKYTTGNICTSRSSAAGASKADE
jgi:hypothetical protein